ncbi:MAG: type III pantothenate kinase [Prolixibacteraceae bacterium]
MNLIIDIGNTRTKIALFKGEELVKSFPTDAFKLVDLQELRADYPNITKAIVSSVKHQSTDVVRWLKNELDFVLELDHNSFIPIQNLYETPETLGRDRIAAAVGANALFPNQHVLVIDAGTAITYDYVTNQNQYVGGFITPGLNMRFKALHHFTDKLPLLKPNETNISHGTNTNNAIQGGIQIGLKGEIDRMIRHFTSPESKLKIILSGGDAKYFEKLLKNYKFVSLEIILLGLNTILESNYIRFSTNHA